MPACVRGRKHGLTVRCAVWFSIEWQMAFNNAERSHRPVATAWRIICADGKPEGDYASVVRFKLITLYVLPLYAYYKTWSRYFAQFICDRVNKFILTNVVYEYSPFENCIFGTNNGSSDWLSISIQNFMIIKWILFEQRHVNHKARRKLHRKSHKAEIH